MAETALTINKITLGLSGGTYSGLDVASAYVAADETNGNSINNAGGRVFIHVKNTGAGAHVVTINSPTDCSQGHSHNAVVSVPATTGERMIGPFDPAEFDQATGNLVTMSWDAGSNTDCTVAALQLALDGR